MRSRFGEFELRRQDSKHPFDLGSIQYGNLDVVFLAKLGVREDAFSLDKQTFYAIEGSQSLLRSRGMEMIDHGAV